MELQPTICVIHPPSLFLLDERVFVSLGILKVAAVLERKGYGVEMVDLSGIQNFEEALSDHCRTSKAEFYGLTATTPQMPAVSKLARVIRREKPGARIVIGGPHVTLVHCAMQKEIKENRKGRATAAMDRILELFHVVIAGDGEEAVFAAIAKNPPRVIDADDRNSPFFLNNHKLENLPFPARHLVDMNSYHYFIEGRRATSLIAQLGCPFECGFCGGRRSSMLRVVRTRSSSHIVQEIKYLYQTYGYTGFMFYDDELNVNRGMVELMGRIAQLQKNLGVEFRLRGFIKAELFTEEQAEAMYRAGFRWILMGFESGAPKMLINMNKKATMDENAHAITIARRHGIKVKALMSIGHPGESRETVMQTHDWLLQTRPDDFDVTLITTYPGTPYYDDALPDPKQDGIWIYSYEKTGDRLFSFEIDYNEVADYYKGDPDGGYRAYVYTDHLSSEELVKLRDFVERDVRQKLNIPFNPGGTPIRYEHSMGQFGGKLPDFILRTSAVHGARTAC